MDVTAKVTEREILKGWFDREGINYDIDVDGGPLFGDPKAGWLNAMLRVRTDQALVVFGFRKDGSLAQVMTQPYML